MTSRPFPNKSSTYSQKNCKTKMNIDITKVTAKGGRKDLKLKTYNVFNELF